MINIWGRDITYKFHPELRVFYIATCFTCPINLYAGYLIYAKTPPEMRDYRYILMHIWAWSSLADVLLILFLELQLFLPLFGGTTSSALIVYFAPVMPDSGYSFWMILMLALVNTSLAILDGFFYRLAALDSVGSAHLKTTLKAVAIFMHTFNSGLTLICQFLSYTPRDEMDAFILREYPQHADIVTLSNYVLLEPALNPHNAYLFAVIPVGNFVVTLMVAWTITTPAIFFYLPTWFGCSYFFFERTGSSDLVNLIAHIFLCLFCLHAFLNVLIVIITIKPYRMEACQMLQRIGLLRSPNRVDNVRRGDNTSVTAATIQKVKS
ncbi:unnamed protein product, partial [Mesorhabditis spiculigera]